MSRKAQPLETRLWSRIAVRQGNQCWEWTGALDAHGYGAIGEGGRGGKVLKVHRLVYCAVKGTLADDMDLHHACSLKKCCNPDHLIPLSRKAHARIPKMPTMRPRKPRKRITHCSSGHPFDEANTYWWKGVRTCRACNLRHTHNRRLKHGGIDARRLGNS